MAKRSDLDVSGVAEVVEDEPSKSAKVIGDCPDEFKKGVAELAGRLGEKEVRIVTVGKHSVVFEGPHIGYKKFPQAE